jgi:hypothetical protein
MLQIRLRSTDEDQVIRIYKAPRTQRTTLHAPQFWLNATDTPIKDDVEQGGTKKASLLHPTRAPKETVRQLEANTHPRLVCVQSLDQRQTVRSKPITSQNLPKPDTKDTVIGLTHIQKQCEQNTAFVCHLLGQPSRYSAQDGSQTGNGGWECERRGEG